MLAEHFKFKANFDDLNTIIVIADCNYIIVYMNAAAINFFNEVNFDTRNKLAYENAESLIGKNVCDFHRNPAYQQKLLDGITDKIKFSFTLGSSDIEINVRGLMDESGQYLGLISEWADVTEKNKIHIELLAANRELAFQNAEKEKRAAELVIANRELAFQNAEKEKRAAELVIANRELVFQNAEKEKRAAELIIANQELAFQNAEKEKRAYELVVANENISVLNEESTTINEELILQIEKKEKQAAKLLAVNKELIFEQIEKNKQAKKLIAANENIAVLNEEYYTANEELIFQINEKGKRATELVSIMDKNEILNQQVNHLQKLESIGRLTAGISHDFNNILACILGFNELNNDICCNMKQDDLKSDLAENTEQITNAGHRAMALIEKMMTYSRQNEQCQKKFETKHTPTLIDEALKMLRPALTSRIQIKFLNHCEIHNENCNDCIQKESCVNNIQIDSTALHQIITNLAVNARDAMKDHGGVISILLQKVNHTSNQCMACHAIIDGDFVELSISDNGTGIAPHVINRIFDPFFTTKPQGEGTGLGLSTLTGLVHSALGHIMIHSDMSELNHGTSFKLLFPTMK